MALTSPAQTISVPLGQAANFGLLSGGNIVADTLAGVRVRGAVGANGTITGNVTADGGIYRPSGPTATTALADLDSAKAYCTALSGQSISGTLGGVSLAPGVYQIAGNAVLDSLHALVLTGATSSTYVFNITGNLRVPAHSIMARRLVASHHIIWNVGGNVLIGSGTQLDGVVLGTSSIAMTGIKFGQLALLTTGSSITITNLSSLDGDNYLWSSVKMLPGALGGSCSTRPFDGNLVQNGSFEDIAGCPQTMGSMPPGNSTVCFWDGIRSTDHFHVCSNGIPNNCVGTQNARSNGGPNNSYTGLIAYRDPIPGQTGVPKSTREYLRTQLPASLAPNTTYYAEFYWSLAEGSYYSVPNLGLYFSNRNEVVNPTTNYDAYSVENPASPGTYMFVTPQVSSPGTTQLTDPPGNSTWSRIGGTFVPPSGSDFNQLLIGNFVEDDVLNYFGPLPTTPVNPCNTPNQFAKAYYYIEDVTVWEIPTMPATTCSASNFFPVDIGITTPIVIPPRLTVTYSWTFNGTALPNTDPFILGVTQNGTYVLTLTINGTPTSLTTVVGGSPSFHFTASNLQQCLGNPEQVTVAFYPGTATGGNPLYTIQSNELPTPLTSNGGPISFAAPTAAGTYVYYVSSADPTVCPGSFTVTVSPLTVVINPSKMPADLCPFPDEISLFASVFSTPPPPGPITYEWFGGTLGPATMGATLVVTTAKLTPNQRETIFSVRATSANGCTGWATFTVRRYFDFEFGTTIGTVPFDNVWERDMRIRGRVVVPNGQTLTIRNDVTIEFADTRNTPEAVLPTGILVQRGGHLIVEEATLRPLMATTCGNAPMWDGIIVEGAADGLPAGTVQLTGSAITQARHGVLAGQPAYSVLAGTVRRLEPRAFGGGGIVTATHTVWNNCYYGVSFSPYQPDSPNQDINGSTFTDCLFTSDAPLGDVSYGNVGMQAGVYMSKVRGITFVGCDFRGFRTADPLQRGIGIFGSEASLEVKAEAYALNPNLPFPNEGPTLNPNTFQRLRMGIYLANAGSGGGGEIRIIGNTFEDNWRGVVLTNTWGALVRGNAFDVGTTTTNAPKTTPGYTFCAGLFFDGGSGGDIQANQFKTHSSYTTAGNRALIVSNISAVNDPALITTLKRNLIGVLPNSSETSHFNIGLYTQKYNLGMQFRCNWFTDLPVGTTSTRTHVGVFDGTIGTQGDVGQAQGRSPKNAFFTANLSTSTPNLRLLVDGKSFAYGLAQTEAPPAVLAAQLTGTERISFPSIQEDPVLNNCDADPLNRPAATIRMLMAGTTGSVREELLVELVRTFLTDRTLTGGLDSAIAVLQAEGGAKVQPWLNQLLVRRGQYGTAQRLAPTGNGTTAQQTTANVDYYTRVLDLLVPFGADSSITAAIANSPALRAELTAMAEDSTTRGSQAARIALNRYAGTHYTEWDAQYGVWDLEEPARAAAPTLALAPNPSTGTVRVSYTLPTPGKAAALRLYDTWGQPAGYFLLEGAGVETSLALRLRPGLYTCVLEVDGKRQMQQRLMITTP